MKRLITTWMMSLLMVLTFPAMAAMSTSKIRQHSRFLTDRMAYELNLSTSQYDDVYEVNYDFLYNTRYLIDDVVDGYTSAIDEYYDYLDVRNDDLRWILTSSQYRRFLDKEYFYRPIYTTTSGSWGFRIYQIYSDITHFYFGKPSHYNTYKGGHYRSNFNNVSYYKSNHHTRYKNNDVYQGDFTQGKKMKQERNEKKEQKRENANNPKSSSHNGNNNGNVSRPSNSSTSSQNGNGNVSRPSNSNNNGNVNSNNSSRDKNSNNNGNVNSNNSSRDKNSNKNQNVNSSSSSKKNSNSSVNKSDSNRSSRNNTTTSRSNTNSRSNNNSTNNSGRSAKRSR